MLYNFLSACTCYIGLFIGILLGEMELGNEYIFAGNLWFHVKSESWKIFKFPQCDHDFSIFLAAGGMFLYIALVDMVPELNSTLDQLSKQSFSETLKVFLLQNIGIIIGILSLFTLAKYQDDIQISFWIILILW